MDFTQSTDYKKIFARLNIGHVNQEVKDEPDVYLLALLTVINGRLAEVSATLHWTVQQAAFQSNLEEARKKLQQPV